MVRWNSHLIIPCWYDANLMAISSVNLTYSPKAWVGFDLSRMNVIK